MYRDINKQLKYFMWNQFRAKYFDDFHSLIGWEENSYLERERDGKTSHFTDFRRDEK